MDTDVDVEMMYAVRVQAIVPLCSTLKGSGTFPSSERKFPVGTFAPKNESSPELSHSGTFVPGSECSREHSFHGAIYRGANCTSNYKLIMHKLMLKPI